MALNFLEKNDLPVELIDTSSFNFSEKYSMPKNLSIEDRKERVYEYSFDLLKIFATSLSDEFL